MFHVLRSVTRGVVEAGAIWMSPFSWYIAELGKVTLELKCPTTNFTPAATKLLATDTPWRGSPTSSPTLTLIFLPRMPPASLMSAIACSAPCLSCAPKAASEPVIGPPIPNLMVSSFWPQPASARPRLQASASVVRIFIGLSPGTGDEARFKPQSRQMSSEFGDAGGLVSRFRSSHHVRHPRLRTSESKDTSNLLI